MIHMTPSTIKRNLQNSLYANAPCPHPKNPHCSTCTLVHWPVFTDEYGEHESIIELLATLQFLNFNGNLNIKLICSYLPFARSYHKNINFNVEADLMYEKIARIFKEHGVTTIYTLDLHHTDLQNLYQEHHQIKMHNDFFYQWINLDLLKQYGEHVIGPDAGSDNRVKTLASLINRPFFILEKKRTSSYIIIRSTVSLPAMESCLIIDDILDTGNTWRATYNYLQSHAQQINTFITHISSTALIAHKRNKAPFLTTNSINNDPNSISILPWIQACIQNDPVDALCMP